MLHPFSLDARKTWPLEKWLQLAERLRSHHLLHWIGSPFDLKKLSENEQVPRREVHLLREPSLRNAIELLEHSALFIGHDSGPAHLACALGKTGVALYPAFTSGKYFPQGAGPFEMLVGDPISSIKVEEVFLAALRGLDRKADPGEA